MTKKKRRVSLLLIVLTLVSLLAGVLFGLPMKSADTVYASRSSNGTDTTDEWKGSQTTPNLIPTLKEGSIASQGWKVSSDGNTQVAANTHHENSTYGYVIKSSGTSKDLGGSNYTGGVYYTLTLSEADRAKANAGQLKISASASFFCQAWTDNSMSIRAEFLNSDGSQISIEPSNHSLTPGTNTTKFWTLNETKVPVQTCTIQVWFSDWTKLTSQPYIANPSCYLHDTTAPSATGITLESPNTSGVIAGDTIRYCIGFNEKVSISSKGTATITLNGTSYNSTDAVIETVGGKSKAYYTFKLPDVNQSGTIKLSSVSGLVVKDEAGNTYTYNNSNPSVPTQQYYKTMNVSCSPAHLKFSGGGTAKFNHDYTAHLSAAHGYDLPETITVKVGSKALSQGSDFTYDSRTGAITIKGALITDDIVITASGVPKKSGVTLHKESGTGGSENATATFDAEMPKITAPTRKGYTFQGYFTDRGGAGTKYYDAAGKSAKNCDFVAPIELYAHWTANHYTIKFDSNKPSKASAEMQGNMDDVPRVYDDGLKALPKNTFTLTGWTFLGWSENKDAGASSYSNEKQVENLTDQDGKTVILYAVWMENSYEITFEPNDPQAASTDVQGSMTPDVRKYDDGSKALSRNGFTLTGWTFQGWATSMGSDEVVYQNSQPVEKLTDKDGEKITLYAVWKQNTYTITFDSNIPENASASIQGNTAEVTRTYDEGDLPLPQNEYTLTGWTFQGWAAVKGNGVTYDNLQAVGNLTPDPNGSVTLYAVWKAHTHKITLNATGGNNAGTLSATYDDPYPDLTLPERYGYSFNGYFDSETEGKQFYMSDGNAAESKYTIDDDITLYAQWSPITYTIWLYSEGSYIDKIENVVYGVLKLPSAEDLGISRKNFDFVGWNVYAEQNWKMYNSDQTYDTGLTGTQGDVVVLNAAWEERPIHSIYFDANGGLGAPAATQAHEQETITLSETVPSRSDHTFLGWATYGGAKEAKYQPEGEFTMGSDAVTLYAVWKHNPSLTYNANEGQFANHVAESYPAAGAEVTVTELTPAREGYTFLGWATDAAADKAEYSAKETFLMPDENTVLYAVWQKREFAVSQSVAESCSVSGLEAEYPYGAEVTFTVTGDKPKVYVNGTRIFGEGENYTFTVTENVSLVIADSSSCVLLYSANGGEDAPTDTRFYATGSEATVSGEIPTRTGYQFIGWSENKEATPKSVSGRNNRIFTGGDDNLYHAEDTVAFNGKDVTLYAVWEANTYTVKYNGMGADGSMTESAHSYGTSKALAQNTFTKTGCNFVGWALSKGGTPVFADGGEVLNLTADNGAEVTLYAVWETMKTVISFDAAGGGGGTASYVVEYGQTLPVSGIMAPVYSGYTFAGYFTDENGAGTQYFDASMRPVGDAANVWTNEAAVLTLYAYWIPTTETLEKSVDEVQGNLESATYALYSALGNSEESLQAQIDDLKAAYAAADALLKGELQGDDLRIKGELEGKIEGLKTTLEAADEAINATIESLEKRLNADIGSLRAELLRDEANISDLQKNLTKLEADYAAADTAVRADFASADKGLQDNIDALEKKLTEAQTALQGAIDKVEKELEKAVGELQKSINDNKTEIDDEIRKLTDAYELADELINSEIVKLQGKDSELTQGIAGLTQSIADLTSAMNAADDELRDMINAVGQRLDQAVSALEKSVKDNRGEIDDEIRNLTDAYLLADRLINEEIEALKREDSSVELSIAALEAMLKAGDKKLQESLDVVERKLDRAVEELRSAMGTSTDIGAKVSALDEAFQTAEAFINSELAGLKAADSDLSARIEDLGSAYLAADEALKDSIQEVQDNLDKAVEDLQKSIEANKTDIGAKVSALDTAYQTADSVLEAKMTAKDGELGGKISDLQTALDAADTALQASIKEVQDNLDKAVEDLQKSIEANETNIEAKVSALDEKYQTANSVLRSELTAKDGELDGKISDLQTALDAADSAMKAAVKQVQDNLDKAVADLQKSIETNETDIEAKVSALDTAYQNADSVLRSELTAKDGELDGKISDLQTALDAADAAMQVAVKQVQENLDKAVADLQKSIGANETDIEAKVSALDTAYQNADSVLRSDMTAKDGELDGKISALQTALDAADTALQASIQKVQDNLDKAVADLRKSLSGNGTDVEEKVAAMNSAYQAADALINSDIAALKAQDSVLAASISALDSAYQAADEALWEGIRQVERKHDSLQQESEKTAVTYMAINIVLGAVAAGLAVTLVVKVFRKKKS